VVTACVPPAHAIAGNPGILSRPRAVHETAEWRIVRNNGAPTMVTADGFAVSEHLRY
jgi:hypothetical protein